MKKTLLSTLFSVFVLLLQAQNGYHDFFLTGIGNVVDKSNGKFQLAYNQNAIEVKTSAVGPNYESFEYSFDPQNLTNDSKLIIGVKSASAFTLRIDLIDAAGKITNTTSTTTAIVGDNQLHYYELDFTTKFSQSWPSSSTVNKTTISKIAFLPNAGGSSFTGTFYVPQIVLGSANKFGAVDHFSSSLFPGWSSSSSYTLSTSSGTLKNSVQVSSNATNGFTFTPSVTMDVTNNPNVSLKVKAAANFNLRVDLVDAYGNVTTASPNVKSVTGNNTWQTLSYSFSGKFSQASPAKTVLSTKIVKAIFYVNNGDAAFSGDVFFDDVTIGDGAFNVGAIVTGTVSDKIIINQVGYEVKGFKKALYSYTTQTPPSTFDVLNESNEIVYTGNVVLKGAVAGWKTGNYAELTFSDVKTLGTHRLKIGSDISTPFDIEYNMYFENTATAPLNFFKNMRHTGTQDKTLSFNGPRNDAVDVSGGWWDAAGDPGKHMSHLSYANYFNPQQIPFVVWSMLSAMGDNDFATAEADIKSEIDFGLDYLVRNVDPAGYLYLAIFDDWGGAPSSREICEWGQPGADNGRTPNYQAAMREGAGIAIAALAKAASSGQTFSKASSDYLQKAEQLYAHLKSAGTGYATKNLEYCNNHEENIIDVYCGLLASVELYKATQKTAYLTDARAYVDRLITFQGNVGELYSDVAKNRPFYHAADEGLPIISLHEYLKVDQNKQSVIANFSTKWLNWYMNLSYEVNNPFDYARENYKPFTTSLGSTKKAFFLPHDNETGYWWQGENARLASMTAALLRAKRIVSPNFNFGADSVSALAVSQLDWVLGKNPFGVCMMFGYGTKNYPSYLNGTDPNKKLNIKGGICNGITSGVTDETDITFMPYLASDWQNWRWVEQWLPHDAWYLMAISTISNIQNTPVLDCANELGGSAFKDSCGTCAGGNTGITPVLNKKACVTSTAFETQESNLILIPNPSQQDFILSGVDNATRVSVYTISGQFVENVNPNTSFGSGYKAGIYILKIANEKQVYSLKAIKH